VYSASDVVVLTSDDEGMPVSLIEAALAVRPCVTRDVGGRQRGGGSRRPTSARSLPPLVGSSITRSYDERWVLQPRRGHGGSSATNGWRITSPAGIYEELAGRSSVVVAS
jgi:hypothetical protein